MSAVTIKQIDDSSVQFSFTNGSLDVLIRHGDLSQEPCDALVNSTNTGLVPNGGLDAQIHQAMGQFFTDQVVAIHKDMSQDSCPIGQSRIFIAKFNRNENDPRFIISTAGPVYKEPEKDQARFLLQSCYYTSLALANIYQLSSISFPAISCGANHFPPNEAAQVAIDSIRRFSFNVKDVRFVLYDRSLFEIFVEEMTDYANQINREIGGNEIINVNAVEPPKKMTGKTKSSSSPKFSDRFCTLCKSQQSSDPPAILCRSCSELPREQVFRCSLANLRGASEKSFDDLEQECQLLQRILTLYPLVYTPVQVFNQTCHTRDIVAEHYLHNYCDKTFRNRIPVAIVGDGNCLYNSFVALGGQSATTDGSPLTPIELRARNIVELVLNIDQYKSQYGHLSALLDKHEDYIREEMVNDTNYASVWDLLSITTVLNIEVECAYPYVNGADDLNCKFLNRVVFIPLTGDRSDKQGNSTAGKLSMNNQVTLLFSHANRPTPGMKNKDKAWTPNHFVPLLRIP